MRMVATDIVPQINCLRSTLFGNLCADAAPHGSGCDQPLDIAVRGVGELTKRMLPHPGTLVRFGRIREVRAGENTRPDGQRGRADHLAAKPDRHLG